MTNEEYILEMVNSVDKIYIDTCCLLQTESLKAFIKKVEMPLIWNAKKISVPYDVHLELLKHAGSDDEELREKANTALSLIEKNSLIFKVHVYDVNRVKANAIKYAFADNKILAKLTKQANECRQLLITNDKKLSSDAYKLNNMDSFSGNYIKVCYLTFEGNLQKSVDINKVEPQKEDYSYSELFNMILEKFKKSFYRKAPAVQLNYNKI